MSSSSSSSSRRRKLSRDQLLKNLEILGSLSAPFPPELPLSPPPSRLHSPVPSSKRKLPPDSDFEKSKRPRIAPPRSIRSDSTEDGELREDRFTTAEPSRSVPDPPSSANSQQVVSASLPVRRPRRGRGDPARTAEIKHKYHIHGKMLKYSGDARFWSTYPPNHRYHRPLANPPNVNSPYHKHGNLIAKLELVDALVSFAYSIWSHESHYNDCFSETWANIEGFLAWCRTKWSSEDTKGEQEKAFLGLVHMIEAYINCRKFMFACVDRPVTEMRKVRKEGLESIANRLSNDIERQQQTAAEALVQAAAAAAGVNKNGNGGSLSTPTMLPSPASASSANSTPTMANRLPANTSASSNNFTSSSLSASVPPDTPQPVSSHQPSSPSLSTKYPLFVVPETIAAFKNQNTAIHAAQWCSQLASKYLNIPILMKHFPMTWARIFGSSLLPEEEYEPDFEDEEGELYWPGQCALGEGLGWLCLMGKAMIQEFGKGIGYKGIDGVIKKEEVVRGREMGREIRTGGPQHPNHHRPPSVPPHSQLNGSHISPSPHHIGPHSIRNSGLSPDVPMTVHKL